MDMDFWASRVKQHLSSDSSMKAGSEANEDHRSYLTCPFCYIDIELSALCVHLQEEHCFDVKNAVCPLCAMNLGKDVVGHFKVHHANSIKSRRKSQKYSSFWSSSSMRELTSYYGFTTRGATGNTQETASDPLLSPFLSTAPYQDSKSDQAKDITSTDASITLETQSSVPSKSNESQEGDIEEMRQKAEFFQHLIVSTII
ncbi:DEHYDRATION-INDUCED 19 homolog 5-like protein [Drosera capensis]